MKKVMYIFGLVLAINEAQALDALKVTVEGRIDFQAGYVQQRRLFDEYTVIDGGLDGLFTTATPAHSKYTRGGFVNDSNFDIKLDGQHSVDLTYGGFMRLHTDTSVATNQERYMGDKALIYLQHNKIGRFEMGNMPGAAGLFEMDTVNLGRGTYGMEGFWSQWVDDRSMRTSQIFNTKQPGFGDLSLADISEAFGFGGEKKTRSVEFIIAPNLLSNYSGHYYSDAPKINVFTKPVPELTLGIAFIPDMDSAGTIRGMAPHNAGPQDDRKGNPPTFRNIVSGGFMYERKLHPSLGIKTGVTGEMGTAKQKHVTNLRAYEAGLAFTFYDKIKVGGTVGSWFDSLTLKEKTEGGRHGSNYYTLSFSHQFDKFGYTLSAMQSQRAGGIEILGYDILNSDLSLLLPGTNITAQSFADPKKNKFRNLALDVDYKLVDGFLPYAGIAMFKFKESQGAQDRGYVAIFGTRLSF